MFIWYSIRISLCFTHITQLFLASSNLNFVYYTRHFWRYCVHWTLQYSKAQPLTWDSEIAAVAFATSQWLTLCDYVSSLRPPYGVTMAWQAARWALSFISQPITSFESAVLLYEFELILYLLQHPGHNPSEDLTRRRQNFRNMLIDAMQYLQLHFFYHE